MKTEHELKKWLEDYFSGLIPEEEATDILAKDPELRQLVEFERILRLTAQEQDVIEFEEKIAGFRSASGENAPNNVSQEPRTIYRVLVLAASLTLIAAASYWFWFRPDASNAIVAADDYIEVPTEIYRSGDDMIDTLQLYLQAGNYRMARSYMEERGDTANIEHVFLRGVCRFKSEAFAEAAADFRSTLQHGDNVYIMDAKLYLAIVLMKIGDDSEARRLLEELARENGRQANIARELLKSSF